MTGKRFQIDDDGDISEFDSNGKWVDCWWYANGEHWKNLCNELNQLSDENEQIKHIIKEAYLTERTALGKSVLKQLMERVGIE